jgi:fibronectin type 3 domain-containing protein
LKNLTNRIYYKIDAVDFRFNHSPFSTVVQVIKPDVVPPMPPVIKGVKPTAEGVELEFIKSSSSDVARYEVYRKHQYSASWSYMSTQPANTSTYKDVIADARHQYQYALLAVDSSGLKSIMCKPVTGKKLTVITRPSIGDFKTEVNREQKYVSLAWTYDYDGVDKYLVYRASPGENLSLYKSVHAADKRFRDTNVKMNTQYSYRVVAVYKDGSLSAYSEEASVNY